MPHPGIFLGSSRKYVINYYANHDLNVLLTYAFDPTTMTSGTLEDHEPEITVPSARLIAFEVFDENEDPIPTGSRSTNSAAFKRWFGNSVVTDRQGRPLVVYHGTPADEIKSFDPARFGESGGKIPGFYFAADKRTADAYRPTTGKIRSQYATEWAKLLEREVQLQAGVLAAFNAKFGTRHTEWDIFLKDSTGDYADTRGLAGLIELKQVEKAIYNVYDDQDRQHPKFWTLEPEGLRISVYLSMQNPFVFDARGSAWTLDLDRRIRGLMSEQGITLDDVDGLVLQNLYDGEVGIEDTIYVVFQPAQIKSTNNRGTWDPRDPRISFNRTKLNPR